MGAVLTVEDLDVRFTTPGGEVHAVRGASFDVQAGETLGIVGESGCGKSVTALSVLGLIRPPGRIVAGRIDVDGRDVLGMGREELRRLRGGDVSMVFQDPMSSLNPVLTIGRQLGDVLGAHAVDRRTDHGARCIELLRDVGIADPAQRLGSYPHQLSGGMRQRVMLAMALANDPALLLADEPTTSLDVTVQAQILELIGRINERTGMAVVLISHDLGVVAEVSQRILVFYAGQIVEEGPVEEIFTAPAHPYTKGLLASRPGPQGARLQTIPGSPPGLAPPPAGCAFAERCPHRHDRCAIDPPSVAIDAQRRVRCWLWVDGGPEQTSPQHAPSVVQTVPQPEPSAVGSTLLALGDVVCHYRLDRRTVVRAVDGVSVELRRGETLALVGESGCGKTTLGRVALRLVDATSGSIAFDGVDITSTRGERLRTLRRRMQLVFQDPLTSLNPRMRLRDIVAEPIREHDLATGRAVQGRVDEVLDLVALPRAIGDRYPAEVSGGQRQRIGIARAISVRPDLLVADEALASLDVSIAGQILNLLEDLREQLGLSYLLISHDLAVVHHASTRVAVMYLGKIVETGPTRQLFARPLHPYTAGLLSATPSPDPSQRRLHRRVILAGEPPSPVAPPSGCRFRTRCPIGPLADPARSVCAEVEPPLRAHLDGHLVACHFAGELADALGSPS